MERKQAVMIKRHLDGGPYSRVQLGDDIVVEAIEDEERLGLAISSLSGTFEPHQEWLSGPGALAEKFTLENGVVLGVGFKIDGQVALTVHGPEGVRVSWTGTLDD